VLVKLTELQANFDIYKERSENKIQELQDKLERAEMKGHRANYAEVEERDTEIADLRIELDDKETIITELKIESERAKFENMEQISKLNQKIFSLECELEAQTNETEAAKRTQAYLQERTAEMASELNRVKVQQ